MGCNKIQFVSSVSDQRDQTGRDRAGSTSSGYSRAQNCRARRCLRYSEAYRGPACWDSELSTSLTDVQEGGATRRRGPAVNPGQF